MKHKTEYKAPDFEDEKFRNSGDVIFKPELKDKTLPDEFYSTSNFPTYIKVNGVWKLAKEPRMDSTLVFDPSTGDVFTREMCKIKQGDLIAITSLEDGSEGVFAHSDGFSQQSKNNDPFKFMKTDISREKPIDYDEFVDMIVENKRGKGYSIWILGPAVIHAKATDKMSWLIENDYVSVMFGGNAVGVHDIENALFGTTLGSDSCGVPTAHGHGTHMRAINEVRKAGSIERLVENGKLKSGIMYNCVTHNVPYVLAGSIRDDGPLPETITDILDSQAAMREHTKKATLVIGIATVLHTIATGNMLPTYIERNETLETIPTICVDQTEFVPNKLADRGTHQAYGVVTNAQDFLEIVTTKLEKYQKRCK